MLIIEDHEEDSLGAVRTGDGGGLLLGLSLPLARLKRLRRQLATQIADLKSDHATDIRKIQVGNGLEGRMSSPRIFGPSYGARQRQPKSGEQGRLDLGFVGMNMAAIFTCLSDFSCSAGMSCFISALVAFTDATSDTNAP